MAAVLNKKHKMNSRLLKLLIIRFFLAILSSFSFCTNAKNFGCTGIMTALHVIPGHFYISLTLVCGQEMGLSGSSLVINKKAKQKYVRWIM